MKRFISWLEKLSSRFIAYEQRHPFKVWFIASSFVALVITFLWYLCICFMLDRCLTLNALELDTFKFGAFWALCVMATSSGFGAILSSLSEVIRSRKSAKK